jgi:hypothetical protein
MQFNNPLQRSTHESACDVRRRGSMAGSVAAIYAPEAEAELRPVGVAVLQAGCSSRRRYFKHAGTFSSSRNTGLGSNAREQEVDASTSEGKNLSLASVETL